MSLRLAKLYFQAGGNVFSHLCIEQSMHYFNTLKKLFWVTLLGLYINYTMHSFHMLVK